jgi:hypothetical protein
MPTISKDLLSDTLHVIQLARETARMQGKSARFEHLDPVVDNLRDLVSAASNAAQSPAGAAAQEQKPPPGPAVVMQDDFQALLNLVQKSAPGAGKGPAAASAPLERSQAVLAMAAGGMSELDIARHLGMTLGEVNMVVSINRK